MADINTTLATLKTLFEAALVSTYSKVVYDYRTFPDTEETAVSLSFEGQLPDTRTTGGDVNYYDITAVISAQIAIADGSLIATEAAQRDADQALNDLEQQIYLLLIKGGAARKSSVADASWMTVSFPEQSVRAPSFVDEPITRIGQIPFRLHMK